MSQRLVVAFVSCAVALGGASKSSGSTPLIWDESALVTNSVSYISSAAQADDFVVTAAARLRSADVILIDNVVDDDGQLSNFSGTLGWAIYADAAGAPGSLVAKGQSTGVSQQETNVQAFGGSYDMVRVHFALGQLVSLAPGTYWFGLREGTWGSGSDGSEARWASSPNAIGAEPFYSLDVTNATSWISNKGATDRAFVLYGDAVVYDQSSFQAGTGASNVTGFVIADDFTLADPAAFSALEVWLLDQNEAGAFDRFSGALSWALYDDAPGAPGEFRESGAGVGVRVSDSGVLGEDSAAIAHLQLALGRTVALDAGTYWLAIHEGSWGSPSDGTVVAWVSTDQNGGSSCYYSVNLNPPGPWTENGSKGTTFVLSDQIVFGSGFDNGSLCAWDGFAGPCS